MRNLNSARIKEIIIISGKYKAQFEQYMTQYSADRLPKRVEFMYAEGANSMGDYLRELEARQKVQDYFVLVHGGLMTNVHIDDLIDEFEAKMQVDNNTVMMKVFSKGSTLSQQRASRTSEYVMMDSENRIMKLDNVRDNKINLQGSPRVTKRTIDLSSSTSATTE